MRKRQTLTALRAFEAVARHNSFTLAASELIVTRPAISKQVRLLEENLNCQLLIRTNNEIELTTAGIELFNGLRQAFDLIAATTKRISTRSRDNMSINILVERDFASSWLAERIGQFLLQHPGISIEINAEHNDELRFEEDFSFRIFYRGKKFCPEFFQQQLLCHWIDIPLCTPEYAKEHISASNNLESAHLIIDRTYDPWQDWFHYSKQSVPCNQEPQTLFNETTLCLNAALAGGGVAIGDSILGFSSMLAGNLIPPFKAGLKSEEAYLILTPKEVQLTRAEKVFEGWLLDTMEQYQQSARSYFESQSIVIIER
ncbi:MAG: DNA-binding transcriptional LysR family regulator [Gammaproteobacteria bacterium]|jgi:DNA-binding transcriptional LysR family regulator